MKYSEFELLLRKRTCIDILIYIRENKKNKYSYQIAKSLNSTYSSVSSNVSFLNKLGLLQGERYGQKIILSLTDKGDKVCNHLIEVKHILK